VGQRVARVHQSLHCTSDETVVDEDVFVDVEFGVAPLEVTGAVAVDPMTQGEILRARRRPDRIRLHETEAIERALQRGRREQGACDRGAPHLVERVQLTPRTSSNRRRPCERS
jgi:hypothetical protein